MGNNKKEYIAFKGSKFTIEWYFNIKGESTVLDHFESLDEKTQIKLLNLFELIGNTGEIKNKTLFNNEGDAIFAFKPKSYRFLCFFFTGKKIIITNAFRKKTQKLPKKEKEKALKVKKEYNSRIKQGHYYE